MKYKQPSFLSWPDGSCKRDFYFSFKVQFHSLFPRINGVEAALPWLQASAGKAVLLQGE